MTSDIETNSMSRNQGNQSTILLHFMHT